MVTAIPCGACQVHQLSRGNGATSFFISCASVGSVPRAAGYPTQGASKYIFRYRLGAVSLGPTYSLAPTDPIFLDIPTSATVESIFVLQSGKLRLGYVFILNGGAICWHSILLSLCWSIQLQQVKNSENAGYVAFDVTHMAFLFQEIVC